MACTSLFRVGCCGHSALPSRKLHGVERISVSTCAFLIRNKVQVRFHWTVQRGQWGQCRDASQDQAREPSSTCALAGAVASHRRLPGREDWS